MPSSLATVDHLVVHAPRYRVGSSGRPSPCTLSGPASAPAAARASITTWPRLSSTTIRPRATAASATGAARKRHVAQLQEPLPGCPPHAGAWTAERAPGRDAVRHKNPFGVFAGVSTKQVFPAGDLIVEDAAAPGHRLVCGWQTVGAVHRIAGADDAGVAELASGGRRLHPARRCGMSSIRARAASRPEPGVQEDRSLCMWPTICPRARSPVTRSSK